MRLLVCGPRWWKNWAVVKETLDDLHSIRPINTIIHGGATGADDMAGRWASENDVPELVFRAEWRRYGRRAGPMRNERMLREGKPDRVLAFQPTDRDTRGTMNMVRQAQFCGVEVEMIRDDGEED